MALHLGGCDFQPSSPADRAPEAEQSPAAQSPLPQLPPEARFSTPPAGDEIFGGPVVSQPFESGWAGWKGWQSGSKSFAGELPDGLRFREAHKEAEFKGGVGRLAGDVPGGESALRIHLEHIKGAYADLIIDQPLPANRFTRVSVYLRSGSTIQIAVGAFDSLTEGGNGLWIQRRVGITAEWQEYVFVIPPQKAPSNQMRFFFRMESDGILDIDDLRIWSLKGDEFNAGLELPTVNAFANTSFPGGLPGGWGVNGAVEAGPDPETPGPSGLPAFRMTTGYRSNLVSPPLRIAGNVRYQLSFAAKGVREGQNLEVSFGPPDKLSTQKVTLAPDWKEYTLSFRPEVPTSGFMIVRFRTGNTIWFDQLRLAAGAPTGFARQFPVEVTVVPSEPYGLFEGRDIQARVTLAGELPPGAKLEWSMEDMMRRVSPVEVLNLETTNPILSLTLTPSLPAYAPYGTFRMQVRALDAEGKPLSAWSEAVLHHLRPARKLGEFAPDSPFGIHILATTEQARMAKKLGFNWMRTHDGENGMTKWYNLERERGKFDFTKADKAAETVRAEKLEILGLLDTAPTFASHFVEATKSGSYYQDALWVPKDIEAWKNYVRTVVAHFKGRINDWEVWNEPYVGMFFNRDFIPAEKRKIQGTPEDYLVLLEAAYAAAKSANPQARIFWATGPYYRPDKTWHQRTAELGAGDHSDALTFHVYNTRMVGAPDDLFAQKAAEYRKGHRLADAPLWNTEGGPGASFNHFYRHLPPFDAPDKATDIADHVVRFFVSQLAASVEKFFLYTFHSWGTWRKEWTLMAQDGTLPPLAAALSNLFWHLEDSKFAGWTPLPDDAGYIARFDRADGQTILVSMPVKPIVPQPGAVDLYGNPLHPDGPLTARTSYLTLPQTKAGAVPSGLQN